MLGVLFVVASLIFDGLTNSQTDKEHKSSGRDFAYSLMFSNNLVSLIGNTLIYIFTWLTIGDDTFVRMATNSSLLIDTLMIGLSGAIG